MRLIHAADIHLGASPSKRLFKDDRRYQKRLNECEDAFFRVLKVAKEENVDAVLLAGDTFDHPNIPQSLFKRMEEAITQANVPVVMILGNHDAFIRPSNVSFFSHPLVHHLTKDTPSVTLGEATFIGQATKDFDYDLLKEQIKRAISSHTVILLHGDVFNRQDDHYLTSLNKLKQLNASYIALGHIHQAKTLSESIAYSGNLEPHDPSETGEKGVFFVDLITKTHRFIRTASRLMHHHTVFVEGDCDGACLADKILKEVPEAQRQEDLVRIILKGTKPLEYEALPRVEARLDDAFYAYELVDERSLELDLETLKKDYENTIIATLLDGVEVLDEALTLALKALLETEEKR